MGFAVEVRATCDKGQGSRMATLGECWAVGVGGTLRWTTEGPTERAETTSSGAAWRLRMVYVLGEGWRYPVVVLPLGNTCRGHPG